MCKKDLQNRAIRLDPHLKEALEMLCGPQCLSGATA